MLVNEWKQDLVTHSLRVKAWGMHAKDVDVQY